MMKNLIELGMETLLQERRDDFLLSLKAGGITFDNKEDDEIIDTNARHGATTLLQLAMQDGQEGEAFISNVLAGCICEKPIYALILIYTYCEQHHTFPPYAIIQHGVDDDLLKKYCEKLAEWINTYIVLCKHAS